VFKNSESTERQYALRQQAIALGWPVEQVIVIMGGIINAVLVKNQRIA
jgi:hypothetical protein